MAELYDVMLLTTNRWQICSLYAKTGSQVVCPKQTDRSKFIQNISAEHFLSAHKENLVLSV